MTVKKGDKIRVDYTGTFDDGTVFDSSEKAGKPLEFVVGGGMLIKGFDEAVLDLKEGDEKKITLKPDEAYGMPNSQLVQKIPRSQLPQGQKPKAGMILMVGMPTGQQMPAMIKAMDDKEVTLDMNHPLAGKTLHFKIKLVEIVK